MLSSSLSQPLTLTLDPSSYNNSQTQTQSPSQHQSSSSPNLTPSTSKSSVKLKDWFEALFTTYAQQYPKLWKVVSTAAKDWVSLEYEVASKKTNPTDFKRKVIQHIIIKRKLVLRSQYPHFKDHFPNKESTTSQSRIFFYDFEELQNHAEEHWKVDKARNAMLQTPQVNDKISLFLIAGLPENRDAILKIGIGKNTNRAECDDANSRLDTIFLDLLEQFSDPGLIVAIPTEAIDLDTILDMDPNDIMRINIKRTHLWIRKLYFEVLKEYNKAFKRWTKGTGGGSGAPADFADWDKRDETWFANYASTGKGDYLAWIYMVDKSIRYVFNTIHDPPPSSTTMEDDDGIMPTSTDMDKNSTGRSTKKSSSDQATNFGSSLLKSVDTGMKLMSDIFKQQAQDNNVSKNTTNNNTTQGPSTASQGGKQGSGALTYLASTHMAEVLDVISALQKKEDLLLEDDDIESERITKRLKITQLALERAYKDLENISK
jgi:hypothetical protein